MGRSVWGLAGKYCAGKNRAAAYLEARGCVVLDADKMGHQVLEEEKDRIAERFGRDILDPEGRIDRKLLGKKVFGNHHELKALEEMVHPAVIGRIKEEAGRDDDRILVINAALLFSSNLYKLCDKVLWITAPLRVRISRGLARDGIGIIQVLKRIWVQRELSPQPWRKDVDIYNIPNPGPQDVLEAGLGNFIK